MHTDHSDAVNLNVLLLKAKALDLEEIRDEIQHTPEEKKPVEKKPKKQKEEAAQVSKSKEKKTSKDEDTLMKEYEQESGKNAIWRGKTTKGYLDWKKEKYGT